MFDWFKSEQRERRKKVRQDRKQLEVRARRFLKSYLEADEVRKPEFYRAVEDISKKCRPPGLRFFPTRFGRWSNCRGYVESCDADGFGT
jgi:hypothetical protein